MGPSAKVLMRISGPLVSRMVATGAPRVSRTFLNMVSRASCSAWEPWEKLKRAAFMPFRMSFCMVSGLSTAGPRVQIILVFLRFISIPPLGI